MSVLIEENQEGYCVAVREWAEMQLGRPLKHTYKNRSNAVRAVRDPNRNTVTMLCQLAWESARRAGQLELILLRITKTLRHYVPDSDVGAGFVDAGSVGADGSDFERVDGEAWETGEGARGSVGEAGGSDGPSD
jgi:hypothetical protein